MKKIVFLFLLYTLPVLSAPLSLFEEAGQLGTMAGLADACGSKDKLKNYELISARLIANKSNSEEEEMQAYRRYVEEKVRARRKHQKSHGGRLFTR